MKITKTSAFYGIVALMLVLLLSGCRDPRARIIVDNQSECPAIQIVLTNKISGEVIRDRIGIGARRELVVQPDVSYTYEFDYTVGGATRDGWRCTDIRKGEVLVQAGNIQTFTLRSTRPTPTPTP